MRDDSLAGQAIATLTAVCGLLDDDGNLDVTPVPVEVTADRHLAGPPVTFVLHDAYPYVRGDHTGPTTWGFDIELTDDDGPVHLRIDVNDPEHGHLVTPTGTTTADQLAALDERAVNVVVNTVWMAQMRSDGHPTVRTFIDAVELRCTLQELCEGLRHGSRWASLVRAAATGTAGTLAADWNGTLAELGDAVGRLRPLPTGH